MPIRGRNFIKSNVVRNLPNLPVDMQYGSISFSVNFGDHPSGTLEYLGIRQEQIARYEIYNPRRFGNRIIWLYGIPFRVTTYNYDREPHPHRDILFDTYKVSVSLEGFWRKGYERKVKVKPLIRDGRVSAGAIAAAANCPYIGPNFYIDKEGEVDPLETISLSDVLNDRALMRGCYLYFSGPNGVEMRDFDRGRTWDFPTEAIVTDGGNSISVQVYYNGSELTGKFSELGDAEPPGAEEQQPGFRQKEPVVEVNVEDDDDAETPHADTRVLRGLDSNFDHSGPKKTRKTTTTIDGKPSEEKVEIFGFSYLVEDIIQDDEATLYSDTPGIYWRKIEEQITRYNYESLTMPPMFVEAFDPSNAAFEGALRLVIHPDYRHLVRLGLGLNPPYMLKSAPVDYQTQVAVTGWKLNRHIKETDDLSVSTLDPTDPRYPLMKPERIPKEDNTEYELISARGTKGYDESSLPFSIEWVDWDSLSPEMQRRINSEPQMGETGNRALGYKVGLITPDLDYVEPLLIITESRQASSFSMKPNPENEPGAPATPAFYITGEESYYKTSFKEITDGYEQKQTDFSAQDPGFKSSPEQVKYTSGPSVRPPEANYRSRSWEQKESNDRKRRVVVSKSATRKRYFLYSDDIPVDADPTDAKNYPDAETIEEAKTAALTELKIQSLQAAIQGAKTVTWFYPKIREGDKATFGRDRFSRYGKWRVASASWSLTYSGTNNRYDLLPLVTCEGTELTLGMDEHRNIYVREKEEAVPYPDDGNRDRGDGVKVVLGNSFRVRMGRVLPNSPGRRR